MHCKTIPISHPKHGEARCNPEQLDEFAELGWEAAEEAPKAKGKAAGKAAGKGDEK